MADLAVNNSQASTPASTPAQTGAQAQAQQEQQKQEQNIHDMAAQENQQKAQESQQKAQENKQAEQKAQDNKEAQQALEQAKIEAEKAEQAKIEAEKAEQAKIEAEKKARQEKEAAEKAQQEKATKQAQQKEAQKAKEEIEEAKEKIELEINDKDVDSILEKSVKLGSFFSNAIKSLLSSGEIDNEEDITVISEEIENIEEQIEEAKEEEAKRAIEEAIEAETTPKASAKDTAKATEDITEAADVDKFAQATTEELEAKEQESEEKIQGLENKLSEEQQELVASLPENVSDKFGEMSENAQNAFLLYLSDKNQEIDISDLNVNEAYDLFSSITLLQNASGRSFNDVKIKGNDEEAVKALIDKATEAYNNSGDGDDNETFSKTELTGLLAKIYKTVDKSEGKITVDSMMEIASENLPDDFNFQGFTTQCNTFDKEQAEIQEAEKAAEDLHFSSLEDLEAQFFKNEDGEYKYEGWEKLYDEQILGVIKADEKGEEITLDIMENGINAIENYLDYLKTSPALAAALLRFASSVSAADGGVGYNVGHLDNEDTVNKLNEIVSHGLKDDKIDEGTATSALNGIGERTDDKAIPNAADKQSEIIIEITGNEELAKRVNAQSQTAKAENQQATAANKPNYITKADKEERNTIPSTPAEIKQKATDILQIQREIRSEQIRLEQIKAEKVKAKETEEAEEAEKAKEAEEAEKAKETEEAEAQKQQEIADTFNMRDEATGNQINKLRDELSNGAQEIFDKILSGKNDKEEVLVSLSNLSGKDKADLLKALKACKDSYTGNWIDSINDVSYEGGQEEVDNIIRSLTDAFKNEDIDEDGFATALAGLYSTTKIAEDSDFQFDTAYIKNIVSEKLGEDFDFTQFERMSNSSHEKELKAIEKREAIKESEKYETLDDAFASIPESQSKKADAIKDLQMDKETQNAFLELLKFNSSSVDISDFSAEECVKLINALDLWTQAGKNVSVSSTDVINTLIDNLSNAEGAGELLAKLEKIIDKETISTSQAYIVDRLKEIEGNEELITYFTTCVSENNQETTSQKAAEVKAAKKTEEAFEAYEAAQQELENAKTPAEIRAAEKKVCEAERQNNEAIAKQYSYQNPVSETKDKSGNTHFTYRDGTEVVKDKDGKVISTTKGNNPSTRTSYTPNTSGSTNRNNNGNTPYVPNKLGYILSGDYRETRTTVTTRYGTTYVRTSTRTSSTIRNAESAVKSSDSEGTSSEVQNLLNSLSSVLAGRANGGDKEGSCSSAGTGAIAAASSKKTGILGNIDSFKNAAKNGNSETKGAYAQNAEEVSKATHDNSHEKTNTISDSQSMEELAKRSQMLQGDLQSEQETRQGINDGSNEAVKQSSNSYKLASQQYRTITNSSNTYSGKIEKEVLSVDENIIQEIQNTEVLSEATRAVGDSIEQQVSYENSLKAGYDAYGAQINTLKEEKAHIDFLDDQNAKRGIEKSIAEAEAKQKEIDKKQEEAQRTEEELKEEKDVLRGLKSESEIAIVKYSTTKQDAKNDLSETKSEIEQNALEDMTKAKSNEQNIKEALTKQSDNRITDTERQLKETNDRMARLREDLPELAASRENGKGDSNDQGQQKPLFKIEKEDQKEVNEKSGYAETVSDIKSAQATAAGNFDTGNGLQSENDEFGGIEEVIAQNAWNQHSAMTSERNESERLGREIASSRTEIASSGMFLNSLASRLRNNGAKLGSILRETAELKSIDLSNVEQSKATEIKRKEKSLRAEKEEAIKEEETLKAKAQAEKEKVESEARERNNNTESQAESVNRYNEAGNQAMSEIEIQRKREEDKRRI